MTKRKKKIDFEAMQREADALVDAIKPMLAGKEPIIIGRALAELTALLIAGHDESMRARIFELHVGTVLMLYPIAAGALRPD
jgi:hypothetical protein